MIRAVNDLDAVAQALGIDTTEYQKAVKACSEEAIKQTATELTAGLDLSGIYEAIEDLTKK